MGIIEQKKYSLNNKSEVIIRTAAAADAEKIIELKKSVLTEGIYMLREIDEAKYSLETEINEIEDYFKKDGSLYLVAEAEGKLVGILDFKNGFLKRTKHAGMFTIFILKNCRNSGIGRLLIDELISWAEKNPLIEKITLNVFSNNLRAIHLYRKCGFSEEGRCPKDMKLSDGTYIDSVLMYKFVK